MADTFNFELVSPEKLLLSVEATEVVAPGSEGYMTVMANHSPLMTTMRPGFVEVTAGDGTESKYFVRGGFADASPEGLTILAEQAVPVAELTKEILAEEIELAKQAHELSEGDERQQASHTFLQQLTELEGHGSFGG